MRPVGSRDSVTIGGAPGTGCGAGSTVPGAVGGTIGIVGGITEGVPAGGCVMTGTGVPNVTGPPCTGCPGAEGGAYDTPGRVASVRLNSSPAGVTSSPLTGE